MPRPNRLWDIEMSGTCAHNNPGDVDCQECSDEQPNSDADVQQVLDLQRREAQHRDIDDLRELEYLAIA